jgi:D-amino peptidase
MRVFISSDIEGVAAVASKEETLSQGFDFARARERMTRETLAAIDGAREAGATGFTVADSHGSGLNLIPEMLPDDVELVRGWPRPLLMMEGVDRGPYACAFLLGYHAGARWGRGGLAHTLSSRMIMGVQVNGRDWPECALSAATAGQFGVPVSLVTGDDAFIEEVKGLLPDAETVTTKRTVSFFATAGRATGVVEREIREAARRAVGRASVIAPFIASGPLEIEVELRSPLAVEVLAYLPIFEQKNASTVRFRCADAAEAARHLQFFLMALPSLF